MNYANHIGYSDINPYEVVRVVSEKCLEVRAMEATRDKSVELEFIPGGFLAHCRNQNDQKWDIASDPSAPVFKIRLTKKRGWADKHGHRYVIADEPVKFYDYNF